VFYLPLLISIAPISVLAADEPQEAPAVPERTLTEKVRSSLALEKESNYEFVIQAPDEFVEPIQEQTFVGRWQSRADYDPVQFDGLVARLDEEVKALLQAAGYFSAEVQVSSGNRRVQVTVNPGERTQVKSVAIEVNGAASADTELVKQLTEDWPLPEGSPYTAAGWEGGKRSLLIALKQAGYLRAEIKSSELRINRNRREAVMTILADSGPPISFGELSIEGLDRYDKAVVSNLRPFAPGDRFNQATLLEFQARLRSYGFFEEVGVLPNLIKLSENQADDRVDLQVTFL